MHVEGAAWPQYEEAHLRTVRWQIANGDFVIGRAMLQSHQHIQYIYEVERGPGVLTVRNPSAPLDFP
jgi:hypothetical protein